MGAEGVLCCNDTIEESCAYHIYVVLVGKDFFSECKCCMEGE